MMMQTRELVSTQPLPLALQSDCHRPCNGQVDDSEATAVRDACISSAARSLQQSALDSDSLLLLMQTKMRDAGLDRAEEGIETNRTRAEHQKAVQEIALKKAEEAGGFLGISGFLGDLLKAVVVIATTVAATVCTGGVGGALAVAGAVLILCAKPITDVAVEVGLVSKEDAAVFQLGVELVGAALTLGSGLAGGGAAAGSTAANAASSGANAAATGASAGAAAGAAASGANTAATTVETIETIAKTIENVTQLLQAVNSGGAAVAVKIQEGHLLDGDAAGENVEHAHELTDGQIEVVKQIMAQSARNQEQLERIREERAEAQMAALRDW